MPKGSVVCTLFVNRYGRRVREACRIATHSAHKHVGDDAKHCEMFCIASSDTKLIPVEPLEQNLCACSDIQIPSL